MGKFKAYIYRACGFGCPLYNRMTDHPLNPCIKFLNYVYVVQ